MKPTQGVKPKNSIKYGTIYALDRHKLAYGNCNDEKLIAELIGPEPIKLIIADPPYGVGYVESKNNFNGGTKHKVIENDQLQSAEEYCEFTRSYLETVKPYLARKNAAYIFNSDKMLSALLDGLAKADFKFAQLLIWVKSQPVINRMDYLVQHELCLYAWTGVHEFLKAKDKSILFYPKPAKSPLHPTMKPISLLRHLILNSSRINDVIYDPFAGSGSTMLACEQTKRKCLTIEIEPDYISIILERFERATGIKPQKIHSPNS